MFIYFMTCSIHKYIATPFTACMSMYLYEYICDGNFYNAETLLLRVSIQYGFRTACVLVEQGHPYQLKLNMTLLCLQKCSHKIMT